MTQRKKTVLFYGDSNTWGYDPKDGSRYPHEYRWTSVAAERLGGEFLCIPCGLTGRTTMYDHPLMPWLNGSRSLDCALQTSKPIDLLVIMLGTNDLNFVNAAGSAEGLEQLVRSALSADERCRFAGPVFPDGAKILIVSPVHIEKEVSCLMDSDISQHEESKKLAALYKAVAKRYGAGFLDAAMYCGPSEIDGLHLTKDAHALLGKAIAEEIVRIFASRD